MELAAVFNPVTANNGTFTATTLQTGSKMIVINKSYVDLVITFPNGDSRDVLANDRRVFGFTDASTVGSGQFKWSQQNIDYPQTVLQLQNIVRIEVYGPTESLAESYPSPITRETLPNLIPSNIGYGTYGLFGLTPTSNATIWGSSYIGVAMAPTAVRGLGYDHFYAYNGFNVATNQPTTTMPDLPATFPSTGKTANDATINSLTNMRYVPGPFSQPGLTPTDTATFLTNNWWTLASAIPWASSTSGFMVEGWINIPAYPNHNMFMFSQDYPPVNNLGVAIYVDVNGFIQGWVGFAGGTKAAMSLNPISINTWHYIALQYTGTTTNTLTLWIDGVQQATTTTSGAPTNSAVLPAIGHTLAIAVADIGFLGSIGYIGISLTPASTIQYQPNSRFIHAQQSINTDYQNAWVRKIDFTMVNAGTAGTVVGSININNLLNTSGLMDALTPTNLDPFHVYVPLATTTVVRFPVLAVNQIYPTSYDPAGLIGHVPTRFIKISIQNLPTGAVWDMAVHGYNILGVG